MNGNTCPICESENINVQYAGQTFYYSCPLCGNFFLENGWGFDEHKYDRKKLKSYLFYHKSDKRPLIAPGDVYSKLNKTGWVDIHNLTPEMVEAWHPKTFAEKVDLALLWLSKHSDYMGKSVTVPKEDMEQVFFLTNSYRKTTADDGERVAQDWTTEVKFLLRYLHHNDLLEYHASDESIKTLMERMAFTTYLEPFRFTLSSKAYDTIYDYQKKYENNRNVFVAMKFGEETQALREKIKEGLVGYDVRIMDEIEHNHQIVPEMLYEIRNSRFVIAELSNHNNGAYYEAGYALGLGKEVIHICKKSELASGLHFDVAQVNTIVYDEINEIPEKLKKRIQATIL